MKYYKANDKLIQHNENTGIYRIRNTTDRINNILSKEQFDLLEPIKIKKTKFCELVNIYFKSIKEEWMFENSHFKKLENFDANGNGSGFKWTDIPLHKVDGYTYSTLKIVYHWGRVYYMLCGGSYFPKGQLVDTKTLKIVQWVDIKNVAPVFNVGTKKIV